MRKSAAARRERNDACLEGRGAGDDEAGRRQSHGRGSSHCPLAAPALSLSLRFVSVRERAGSRVCEWACSIAAAYNHVNMPASVFGFPLLLLSGTRHWLTQQRRDIGLTAPVYHRKAAWLLPCQSGGPLGGFLLAPLVEYVLANRLPANSGHCLQSFTERNHTALVYYCCSYMKLFFAGFFIVILVILLCTYLLFRKCQKDGIQLVGPDFFGKGCYNKQMRYLVPSISSVYKTPEEPVIRFYLIYYLLFPPFIPLISFQLRGANLILQNSTTM